MRLPTNLTIFAASVALLGGAPVLAAAPVTGSTPTTVTFKGVETPKGNILVAVYDAAGWTGGRPVAVAMTGAGGPAPTASLAALPVGRYAIKAFHDLDGDGKMGVNPFGMPTEPFAFSNDAHGERGPASFEAAAFEVVPGGTALTITIR